MSSYILRDLPQTTWDRFKARCHRDGWHMRALFLQLMDDYGTDQITPSRSPTGRIAHSVMTLTCPNGHTMMVPLSKADTRAAALAGRLEPTCWACGDAFVLDDTDRANLESWAHSRTPPSAT